MPTTRRRLPAGSLSLTRVHDLALAIHRNVEVVAPALGWSLQQTADGLCSTIHPAVLPDVDPLQLLAPAPAVDVAAMARAAVEIATDYERATDQLAAALGPSGLAELGEPCDECPARVYRGNECRPCLDRSGDVLHAACCDLHT